jgi:hypothetical protein
MIEADARGTPQDDSLVVVFHQVPRQDQEASEKEGRPVFKDVEYIRIIVPGSRDHVDRPASDIDRRRFARRYAEYQQKQKAPSEGTPLAEWPIVTRSQVEELKFFNIFTVEQLAALNDAAAGNHMGIQALKRKAQDFIKKAKDDAPMNALRTEIEKKDAELASLKAQLKQQGDAIEELRKRGSK